MLHVLVVAGGEMPTATIPSVLVSVLVPGTNTLTIAVDHGLDHCLDLGIVPDVLLGDLDSASSEALDWAKSNGTNVIAFPADKDATDLELALDYAVDQSASTITVLAAFGGRLDHELASIGLLASPRYGQLSMCAVDGRRAMWVVREHVDLALPVGATVSLIPWTEVDGVTTAGLQWPLVNDSLPLGSTRGISNVCVDLVQRVKVTAGVLLVVADSLEVGT